MKLTSKDIDWKEGKTHAITTPVGRVIQFDFEPKHLPLGGFCIIEREQAKLRLDYLLKREVKTAVGDKFFGGIAYAVATEDAASTMNKRSPVDENLLITSFSPRKNAGCLPVPEDVPVLIFCDDKPDVSTKTLAGRVNWTCQCFSSVVKWMPDIDELIKQQIEHDAKSASVAPEYLEIPNTITVKDDMDLTDIKPAKVPTDIENIKVKVAKSIDKTKADKQLAELMFKGSINRQVRDLGDAMNHFTHSTNEEAINMLTTAITRCKEIISEMAK